MALPRGAVGWSAVYIVLVPEYTYSVKKIDSIALFGTYCICLTNVHRSNRYEAFNKTNKQLICVAKSNDHKQKAFQTDYREIRYDCAKR